VRRVVGVKYERSTRLYNRLYGVFAVRRGQNVIAINTHWGTEIIKILDDGDIETVTKLTNSRVEYTDGLETVISIKIKKDEFETIKYAAAAEFEDIFGLKINNIYELEPTRDEKFATNGKDVLACGLGCTKYGQNGIEWTILKDKLIEIAEYVGGYWYIATGKDLIIVDNDGKIVRVWSFKNNGDGDIWVIKKCCHLLAVSTFYHLYLYDVSDPENPREIWNKGGFNGLVSIDFYKEYGIPRVLAATDKYNKMVKILNIGDGEELLSESFELAPISVAFTRDYLVIGDEHPLTFEGRGFIFRFSY